MYYLIYIVSNVIDEIKSLSDLHELSLNLYQYSIEMREKLNRYTDLLYQKELIIKDNTSQLDFLRKELSNIRLESDKLKNINDQVNWGPLTESINKYIIIVVKSPKNKPGKGYNTLQSKIQNIHDMNQIFSKEKQVYFDNIIENYI